MNRPALSLLRVKRLVRQISMQEASVEIELNISDYGKVERLQMKPSKRVAALLAERYGQRIENLLAPLRP